MKTYRIPAIMGLVSTLLIPPTFAQTQDEEQVFELSPFEVDASQDQGYIAASSLAGTRFKTNLEDIASSISVFTDQFIDDLQIQSAEELADFSMNQALEVGDSVLNGDTGQQRGMDWTVQRVRIRGLSSSPGIDYFRRLFPGDGYNTGRYDESRGPNGILFGISNAGGITNSSTLSASPFSDYGRVRVTTESNGGLRGEFRYNKQVIKDTLGVVVAGVKQTYEGWQNYHWNDREGIHAGLTYKVNDKITFRVKGEDGSRSWSNATGSAVNAHSVWIYQDWLNSPNTPARLQELGLTGLHATPGNRQPSSAEKAIGIGSRLSNYGSQERWFYVSNDQHLYNAGGTFNPRATEYGNTGAESPDGYATDSWLYRLKYEFPRNFGPGPSYEYVKDVIPGVINTAGLGASRNQDFSNITFELDLRITDNFFINVGHNQQDVDQQSYQATAQANRIGIERNLTRGLSGKPGYQAENPYTGQAMLWSDWRRGNNYAEQESSRITATYLLDFTDADGWLSWLGSHQLAAMYSDTTLREHVFNQYLAFLGAPWNSDFDNNDNKFYMVKYFPIEQMASDPSSIFIPPWWEAPGSVMVDGTSYDIGWVNQHHNSSSNYATGNRGTETAIKSYLAVLQSRFWNNKIVTTLGFRKDKADLTRFGYFGSGYEPGVYDPTDEFVQESDPLVGRYIDFDHIDSFNAVDGDLFTAGAVYHLTDWLSITGNVATNIGIPDVQRIILPGVIPPPSEGEGFDVGLRFSLFDNKLIGRLVYYQNNEIGVTDGAGGGRIVNIVSEMGDVMTGLGLYTEDSWANEMSEKGYDVVHTATLQDTHSQGWEFQVTGNLTRNWRLTLNASKVDRLMDNFGIEVVDFWGFSLETDTFESIPVSVIGIAPDQSGEYRVENIDAYAAGRFVRDMLDYGAMAANAPGSDFDIETSGGFEGSARSLTEAIYRQQALAVNGARVNKMRRMGLRPYRANVFTAYDFDDGMLDGFSLGGGVSWQDSAVVGLEFDGSEVSNDELITTQLMLRYDFKDSDISFLADNWSIQLNIYNVFDDTDPIVRSYSNVNLPTPNPYTPGGVGSQYRVPDVFPGGRGPMVNREDLVEGRNFRLTVTYSF